MKLKKNFVIMLFILIISNGLAWTSEPENQLTNEYFIIGTNVMLNEVPDTGAKGILLMNEFDKVMLSASKPVNDNYNVILNGTNGWVDVFNVSLIPTDWIKFNKIDELILYFPKNFNFTFHESEKTTNRNKDGSKAIEYKIGNDNFLLDINYISNKTFESEDKATMNYYGINGYFYSDYSAENGNKLFELMLVNEIKKEYYQLDYYFSSDKPTYEEELTAKKILFSVRIKDTNKSSEKPSSESTSSICTLTGDNVNVRAEAATNGAVLVKLSRGAIVTLLKRSDMALTVGDKKGFWAYIDTQVTNKDGETVKGWVFDYYLKPLE